MGVEPIIPFGEQYVIIFLTTSARVCPLRYYLWHFPLDTPLENSSVTTRTGEWNPHQLGSTDPVWKLVHPLPS